MSGEPMLLGLSDARERDGNLTGEREDTGE